MIGLAGLWNRLFTRTRQKGRRRVRTPGLSCERYGIDLLEKRQMFSASPASDFSYTTTNGQVAITGYIGSSAVVEIPDAIDSLPVTSIGDSAFLNHTSLTSVSISERANVHLQDFPEPQPFSLTGGIDLPDEYTGSLVLGGVPFAIQQNGLNGWNSFKSAGPNPRSLDLVVGVPDVTAVYTLINTYWGTPGPTSYATIEFFGSAGAYYERELIGGVDIRDYNSESPATAAWTQTINGSTTKEVLNYNSFGLGQRLDMQTFTLPTSFQGQALESIRLTDTGGDTMFQRLILSGVSVAAVTPATTPGLPTAVAGIRGNGQAQLSWTAPVSDGGLPVKDYTIQYSTDGSSWQTFSRAASAATSATVTGLINGTGYLFRVASVNDLGTGAYSAESAVVTPVLDFAYTKTNGQVTITGYAGSSAAVEIPSTIDGLPVTAIADNAFWSLSWITSISIPSGVESIGFGSFAGTGITTLDLPARLKSFSNSVYACQNLASIYVDPANSLFVSIDGILYDKSLQTVLRCPQARTLPVTLPETVIAVAANAFAGCTQVTVVNGLQPTASIGWDAFAGCNNLRHVLTLSDKAVPGDYLTYTIWTSGVIVTGYFGTGTGVVVPETILGRPVVGIGSDAFNTRGALESIVIPRSVTGIGNAAFANCTNLKSIVIPDQVAYIGFNAFQYCTSLTSISLPASLTHIGAVCFFGCSNLVSIEVDGGNANFASVGGLLYDKTLSTLIDCPEGKSGTVVLPASVTAIGREGLDMTFAECKQLTRIVIPGGVTAIVGRAFENCPAIVETTGASPFGPGNLEGVRGNGEVRLSWTAPVATGGMSVTDYTVQYSVDGSSWQTFSRAASTATTATVTGLVNGTGYLFRVASVNGVRTGVYSANSAMVTPSTVPDAPAAGTGVRGNGQVQLSWTAPVFNGGGAVTDYTIQYSSNSGASWQTFTDAVSAATSATVTGLTNGTGYLFRVASVNDVGAGSYSANSSTVTPATTPGSPTAVTGIRGNGQVQLSWTAPVSDGGLSVTDYTIQYSSNSGSSWQTFTDAVSAATSATVTGLTNGTGYLFRVASVNNVGAGLYSANSSAVTPATTPGSPTAVTGARGNGQVQLSWTAPVSDGGSAVTDYTIQHSTDSGSSWQTVTDAASSAASATVTGLTNGTGYLFRVASVNEVGTGSFTATSSSITPTAVPLPPSNVITTRGKGIVIVSWTAPVSTGGVRITDYRVQQSTNGGLSWVTVRDGVSTSTRTVVSGFVMGRDYIFRVASVGRFGAGDSSSPSRVVVPATAPSVPVGLLATGGIGQVALSWRAPTSTGGSPINQYIVQYSPSAGRWLTSTTVGSNTTTASIGGLLANRPYSLRVLAVNDMGNSPASRVVAVKTLRASPTLVQA
jgi:hypothetical protein